MAQETETTSFGIDGDWDRLYVNGGGRDAPDDGRLDVTALATRLTIATVPAGTPTNVNEVYATSVPAHMEQEMIYITDRPINDEAHVPFGGGKASGVGRYNGGAIPRTLTEERRVSIQHDRREYPV